MFYFSNKNYKINQQTVPNNLKLDIKLSHLFIECVISLNLTVYSSEQPQIRFVTTGLTLR